MQKAELCALVVQLQAQQDRSPGILSTERTNNRAVGQEIFWWAPEEVIVCIRKPENLEVMKEGREKNHSVLETGRQAEKREWDCKDRQVGRKRERCNSAPAPAWFIPPPLSCTRTTHSSFFTRKRNNVPQVKELSQLFSFPAKLTLSTWNKGYLEK